MLSFPAIILKLKLSGFSTVVSSAIITKSSKCFNGIANQAKLSTSFAGSALSDHLKSQLVDEAPALFHKISSPSVYLRSKMIVSYAASNRLDEALKLFEAAPAKDTVMWNLMIKGCLDCGDLDKGEKLFDEMPKRNVITWTTMINGLFRSGRIKMAEQLFHQVPARDTAVWNSMIYGYFSNARVEEAMDLFKNMPLRNVISWTSMISGLDQHGRSEEALCYFRQMLDFGVNPTESTFTCVITSCSNVLDKHLGIQIHGLIVKLGFLTDLYITASLITFYAKCKEIADSCKIFNETLYTNVVVWTALLTGYSLNCKHVDALKVFGDMLRMGVFPNQSSFTSALNSCCELEAVDQGEGIQAEAIKLGLESDTFIGNSLVVLYSKCGKINDGLSIFKKIAEKNIVSWNSIIVGSAQHGCGMWAMILFNQMIRAWVNPDEITFTGLLSACNHSGMLQKGKFFFEYFRQCKFVELKIEHYACLVGILGRSGQLNEAEELIQNMPMKASLSIWLALLSGCRMHSNVDVAERAAKEIIYLDRNCSAAYVLLSNLYAFYGRWDDAARIRRKMKKRRVAKQPGISWITLKGQQHTFICGDRSHPLSDKVYQKLDWLGEKLKEFGYVPDQRYALHDVEDEQKEEILSYHSERLAIGFALLTTVEGSTITIMKNLRVCGDCHSAIKLVAKIVGREIVLRDSSRFHHFNNGFCSCRDYW